MPENGKPKRRTVLKTIGGITTTGALAGCSSSGDSGSGGDGGDGGSSNDNGETGNSTPEPLTYDASMGIIETELNQIPSLAAFRNMLPEVSDDRLTGSYRTFRNSNLPMQAMIGGEINYYALSFGNVVGAHLAGNDLKVLGPKLTGTDYQMVVRTDIEASSLEELVNGDYNIGVAGLGGLSHMQVAGVLAQEGLPTDVEEAGIQNIGGSGTRTSAVASGQIDATAIHIDQVKRIQSEGAPVEVLFDFREYFPNFISQTMTVTQEFLDSEEGGAHAQAYTQTLVEANEIATNNFEWVHQNAQQLMAHTLDEEDARESWKFNAETINTWQHTKDGYNNEDFEKYVQALVAANVLSQEEADQIDYDEMLVHDYWNQAVENKDPDQWL